MSKMHSKKQNDTDIAIALQEGGYVGDDDLIRAVHTAQKEHVSLVEVLLREELITKDLFGQAIAEHAGVMYADINSHPPTREQVLKIPEHAGRTFRVVFFHESDDAVVLATDTLATLPDSAELQKLFPGKKITFVYGLTEDIDQAFLYYRKALQVRFERIVKKGEHVAPKLLETLLDDALTHNASDVHFEPQENQVVVRFRVDGVLHEAGHIPNTIYEQVLNRIKVQAHLRTDEHRATQDGAIRYTQNDVVVDIRVSIVPVLEGEKVVFRLLSEYVQGLHLGALGLVTSDEEILERVIRKPFGMILNAGPTGSGKTTTMYSLLKVLNTPEVNIATIEDPVEYKIIGVNHIQVDARVDLTFAKGLRSIVRQDPDIILVGEIRDNETAEIAVNAALTGHLMLSTFHANDAATAIPRLLDMGIEPFLLASTLELVIAQRLVRKICEQCRYSYSPTDKELKEVLPSAHKYFKEGETLYRGKGCIACNSSGFAGRTALFEFIEISKEMKELLLTRPSTDEIQTLSRTQGGHSLFDNGIVKVKNGTTTLEELVRVALPQEL